MKQDKKQTEMNYLQKLDDLTQALNAVVLDKHVKSDRFTIAMSNFTSALLSECVFLAFFAEVSE